MLCLATVRSFHQQRPAQLRRDWRGHAICGMYTIPDIEPRLATSKVSIASHVRSLGYRVGAPNAGLPAGRNAGCLALFVHCKMT